MLILKWALCTVLHCLCTALDATRLVSAASTYLQKAVIPQVVKLRHVDFGLVWVWMKATHQLSAVNAEIADVCLSSPTPPGGVYK